MALCALGVAVRLGLLLAAGDLELQSDEANYVYLAVTWNHFGVYLDEHRYLWPPGYAWFLGRCLAWFGVHGLLVAKLLQVLASAVVGASIMVFARRLFDQRTAIVAGFLWVFYLPLAAFTHLLWNETLFLACFLPALYGILRVLQEPAGPAAAKVDRRLVCAGVLLGAALHLKEAPLYLVPILCLLLLRGAGGLGEGLRRASLLGATVAACLLPWTLRNYEVYGRLAPVGASLGENVFNGLNADYRCFDMIPVDVVRSRLEAPPLEEVFRPWFVASEPDSGWARVDIPEVINTIDRSVANRQRGLAYAREHPGWLVRSRIKKLADLVTPLSFYTRHLALGRYDQGVLGGPVTRKLTSLWALACPLVILILGSAGFFLARLDPSGRWLIGTVFAYFGVTALLVSMSRFRLPLVPFLIVLAAGLVARRPRDLERRAPVLSALACLGALVFLWWVDLPEIWTVFSEMVWRPAA